MLSIFEPDSVTRFAIQRYLRDATEDKISKWRRSDPDFDVRYTEIVTERVSNRKAMSTAALRHLNPIAVLPRSDGIAEMKTRHKVRGKTPRAEIRNLFIDYPEDTFTLSALGKLFLGATAREIIAVCNKTTLIEANRNGYCHKY